MNLHEMHRRQVAPFLFAPSCQPDQQLINGCNWLGFTLTPSPDAHITIQHVMEQRQLRSFPPQPHWLATGIDGEMVMRLVRQTDKKILSESRKKISAHPTPLEFPWPALSNMPLPECQIEISYQNGQSPLFLGISRTIDRAEIINLCQGRGVEIGPGVSPQIHPTALCNVDYIEEKSREDWLKTYSYKIDKYEGNINALPWERYHVASALTLPVADNSLDFIFSSHVFEHLVNPIAHFAHWLQKLKAGGLIAGILPHCDYSVDSQMLPSMLPTMALEYQRKETHPNINHYKAIFGNQAAEPMAEGRTLHVHFYNERNLQDFFSFIQSQLPLGGFQIKWERNYKEFFFVAYKKT